MISAAKPNVKAMHELVLYFMRERTAGNDDIKYLIATNINEWFIFSASDFNDSFYKVPKFRKDYEDWKDGKKVSSNTDHFYNDIAKPYIEGIDKTLECTYFDLREYAEELTSVRPDSSSAEKKLIALYKLLSPYFLLKQKLADDSSTLDKKFYTELLHIIGLEEHKEKSKTLIRRKADKSDGSLIEKAISKLETEYFVYEQGMWKTYGDTKDEQIYNAALELCIVWVNRILFLKLLEGQLAGYHDGEAAYRFLDTKTVNNFNELYTLFHDVLNCTVQNRKADIGAKYSRVPYLNSSLFDFADVERDTIRVSSLDENLRLSVNGTSILKKLGETAASLPTLEYLLRFLDAYDFASEGKEDIQKENRPLINASVLGKVFEKINGYKDGSIYTPGFITMYMCRQTIRLAVIQKFKEAYGIEITSFNDLYIYISKFNSTEKLLEFNAVIDSIKICDPAVGSGHFLVSALNEILAIKSELEIFADENGKPFGKYSIVVANDELVIKDQENNLFEYKIRDGLPLNAEMQCLQKTLFHEKQKLIENCLFGVDINPNSVKICRLRLWIELLKNAYYKLPEFGVPASAGSSSGVQPTKVGTPNELETLPNIDINIKEGNSLISRYKLQDNFKTEATNRIIKEYRELIGESKNVKDKARKDELKLLVRNHKKALASSLEDETTAVKQKLDKKHARLNEINHPKLFEKTTEAERDMMSRKIQKEIDVVENELHKVESKYDNSFEWRFEFPEVLDADGVFLGFDIVIGNPPYLYRNAEIEIFKDYFRSNYHNNFGNYDLYKYFIERAVHLTKHAGVHSFVTNSSFLIQTSFEKTREFILKNTVLKILAPLGPNAFDEATVDSVIYVANKHSATNSLIEVLVSQEPSQINVVDSYFIRQERFLSNPEYVFDYLLNDTEYAIVNRLFQDFPPIDSQFELGVGINTGYIKGELTSKEPLDFRYHPMVPGTGISRYGPIQTDGFIMYDAKFVKAKGKLGRTLPKERFFTEDKILVVRTRNISLKQRIIATIDVDANYNLNRLSNIISKGNMSVKYLLGILNSSLFN